MVINGLSLLMAAPIKDMISEKRREHGVSWGLSEIGYDIRTKQKIEFQPPQIQRALEYRDSCIRNNSPIANHTFNLYTQGYTVVHSVAGGFSVYKENVGRTALASSIEEFDIPSWLWCEFRNKSTHARRFIDATLGTDGEPGWKGNLTIEIIFHGNEPITIPAGSAILKAVFHTIQNPTEYVGKYQNQEDRPVEAIYE